MRERERERRVEKVREHESSTPEIILLVLYARFSIVLSGRHERRCKNSPTFFASSSYHHLQPRRCRYSFPTLPTWDTDMPPTHLYPNLLPLLWFYSALTHCRKHDRGARARVDTCAHLHKPAKHRSRMSALALC